MGHITRFTEPEVLHLGQPDPATANPKDLIGAKKVALSLFPPVALAHGAHAMMNGAAKYGPYNWREKPVQAHIYVEAAQRHLLAWFDREKNAPDSGVHHLGHVLACIAILLDAEATGNLVDDRPTNQGVSPFAVVLEQINHQMESSQK